MKRQPHTIVDTSMPQKVSSTLRRPASGWVQRRSGHAPSDERTVEYRGSCRYCNILSGQIPNWKRVPSCFFCSLYSRKSECHYDSYVTFAHVGHTTEDSYACTLAIANEISDVAAKRIIELVRDRLLQLHFSKVYLRGGYARASGQCFEIRGILWVSTTRNKH